ncbi:DUF4214 domain-containing protein [Mesorhizobium sp. PUT5]|uniref:DUF4214 domain-containing protein n=1 Tax=Mesorhizobium sp. PUT5 TaxID=3454629 RepID=UPI003FA4A7CA
MATFTNAELVAQLYIGFYDRAPDPVGLNYWVGRLDAGVSVQDVGDSFAASPEAADTYPYIKFPNLFTPDQFLEQVYQNVFGRAIDDDGLDYYKARIESGESLGSVVSSILGNATTNDGSPDQAYIANKVAVGLHWAEEAAATGADIYQDNGRLNAAADASAKAVIALVTNDPDSVDAGNDASDAFFATGNTVTLTTEVQALTGTSGNDTFIAGSSGILVGGAQTLNPGDSINGGAGNDTLVLYGNANAAAFAGANIVSIETVNAQLAAGALDVSGNADVQQANVIGGSTGANGVTLTMAQTAGVQGNAGATANFTFTDASALTTDSANIALNNAVLTAGIAVIGGNVETLNIAAAGTNAIGNLDDASLTTLNISGKGSLEAVVTSANVTTVDASGNSGGVDLNLMASAAQNQTIKGGSGDDVITTTFLGLTNKDTIDLGAGKDALIFTDATSITTATDAGKFAKVSGVEVLGTTGGANLTVDASLVSQNEFAVDGNGAMIITNASNGVTADFGAGVHGASSIGLLLGATTANVNLDGGAAIADLGTNGLTITGSQTVNLDSTGVVGVAANTLGLTIADNNHINITGDHALTLTLTNASLVTGETVDASAFSAVLTVTGTAQTDSITGGSGNDVIQTNGGADVLTGGAGNDHFVIDVNGVATAANAINVTDFGNGADWLSFTAMADGTAANYSEGTAAVADYAAALTAATAALTATIIYSVQQVGSDLYVFADVNGDQVLDAADAVVKLTGVSLDHFGFGDIHV